MTMDISGEMFEEATIANTGNEKFTKAVEITAALHFPVSLAVDGCASD